MAPRADEGAAAQRPGKARHLREIGRQGRYRGSRGGRRAVGRRGRRPRPWGGQHTACVTVWPMTAQLGTAGPLLPARVAAPRVRPAAGRPPPAPGSEGERPKANVSAKATAPTLRGRGSPEAAVFGETGAVTGSAGPKSAPIHESGGNPAIPSVCQQQRRPRLLAGRRPPTTGWPLPRTRALRAALRAFTERVTLLLLDGSRGQNFITTRRPTGRETAVRTRGLQSRAAEPEVTSAAFDVRSNNVSTIIIYC